MNVQAYRENESTVKERVRRKGEKKERRVDAYCDMSIKIMMINNDNNVQ